MPIVDIYGWENFEGGTDPLSCNMDASPSGDMDCDDTASVTVTVSGGVPPYSWSIQSGGGQLSGSSGSSVTLTPENNPWAGDAGIPVFRKAVKFMATFCDCRSRIWDCYGNIYQDCAAPNSSPSCAVETTCSCSNCINAADARFTTNPVLPCDKPFVGDACAGLDAYGCYDVADVDEASNPDCKPCVSQFLEGTTVQVEDAIGQTAFATVNLV